MCSVVAEQGEPASKHWSARARAPASQWRPPPRKNGAAPALARPAPRGIRPRRSRTAERGCSSSARAEQAWPSALATMPPVSICGRGRRVAVRERVEGPLIVLIASALAYMPRAQSPAAIRYRGAGRLSAPRPVRRRGPPAARGSGPPAPSASRPRPRACATRCDGPRGCSGTRFPGGARGGTGDPAPASPDRRRRARRAPRFHRTGLGRDRLQQRRLGNGPDHRRFLDDPAPAALSWSRRASSSPWRVVGTCAVEASAVKATHCRRGPAPPRSGRAQPPRGTGLPPARSRIWARRCSGKRWVESPNHAARRSPRCRPRQRHDSRSRVRAWLVPQRIRLERRPIHQEDEERTVGELSATAPRSSMERRRPSADPRRPAPADRRRAAAPPGRGGHEDLALELLRLQMAHARVVLLEPEHPGERGHHRRAILRADAERLQACRELAPRDLDGIAVLHLVLGRAGARPPPRRSARPAPSTPRAGW